MLYRATRAAESVASETHFDDQWLLVVEVNCDMDSLLFRARESEVVHQIPDCRAIGGHIRIARLLHRVRQVVSAAPADRRQAPVLLDELLDRNMVAILVRYVSAFGVLRNDE